MYTLAGADNDLTKNTLYAIAAELTIMAYFFAMRSCEFSQTPQPGRTKIIRLRGIVFRDSKNAVIENNNTDQLHHAFRVTLTFEDQKNGTKNDRRTHQCTTDPVLCPVKRLVSLVQRIYRTCADATPDTPINLICLIATPSQISSTIIRQYLRSTCTTRGGKTTFGYDAADIGTKSIRSGAAMGLFLMNHPVHKIMILGRWSSDAFLVYIRPQVLEWTNNMSQDMIHFNSYTDATDPRRTQPSDPRTRQRLFNGDQHAFLPVAMQNMHLHH